MSHACTFKSDTRAKKAYESRINMWQKQRDQLREMHLICWNMSVTIGLSVSDWSTTYYYT